MEAAEYSDGGCGGGGWWEVVKGNKGDIDSAAPATVPRGHQVKEGGKAPTDGARKRKEQGEKAEEGK